MRLLALYDTMDLPETALINGIAESGVEVVVAANPARGYYSQLSPAISQRVELHCRSRLDIHAIRVIRQLLTSAQFDLVHAFTGRTLSAALFASSRLRAQPRILTYRGALGNVGRFDPSSWISFRHPRVAGIFCVSEAVRRNLIENGFPERMLKTIYKGHDIAWYKRSEVARREEFQIDHSAFVVCCVANMRPNKGLDDLLKAARLCVRKGVPLTLLLIGEMEGIEQLEGFRELHEQDRVRLLGYQADVARLLPLADCFVMPTKYVEGFPKAVIEAMSVAVPVLVTAIGGMLELVRDEVDGLVVAPRDPQAIAAAIERLQQDDELHQRLAASGRERITTNFPVARSIEETLRWYREQLGVQEVESEGMAVS